MRQMEKSADVSVQRINAALGNIGKGTMRDLAAPLTGITAALGTRELIQYADAWTQAGNLIRASATAVGVGARSLNELKEGANEARTSLETYTELYARLIRSASGVAKSEEEIALDTNLVAKAMKAGGASAQEQQASLIQLGQALGSGVLQGDELRSLRENAPVIAKAIADEFKTTITGLKQLGADGKLTSDRVFKAIFRKNGGPVTRAGGGIVRGPGGPRGDKIPAMLSDEEFVVNAAATKRNRALLEAINSGRVIGLKDGGSPLRAPSMLVLRSPTATQQAQAGKPISLLSFRPISAKFQPMPLSRWALTMLHRAGMRVSAWRCVVGLPTASRARACSLT